MKVKEEQKSDDGYSDEDSDKDDGHDANSNNNDIAVKVIMLKVVVK